MGYDYDDDDLVDYADASDYDYDEEDLLADIASVRSLLGDRQASEKDIKDALEQADYDVERAAKTLRVRIDKEKKSQEKKLQEKKLQEKKLQEKETERKYPYLDNYDSHNDVHVSKLSANAILASNLSANDISSNALANASAKSESATEPEGLSGSHGFQNQNASTNKPLSKLALLAQARAAKTKAAKLSSAGDSLNRASPDTPESAAPEPAEPGLRSGLKSVSLLDRISSRTQRSSGTDSASSSNALGSLRTSSSASSKLASLRKPDFASKKVPVKKPEPKPKKQVKVFPVIDYGSDSEDAAKTTKLKTSILSDIFVGLSHFVPRSLPVTNLIYAPSDAQTVQQALAKESPDDIVLKAQESAFTGASSRATTTVNTPSNAVKKPTTSVETVTQKTKDLALADDPLESLNSLKSLTNTRKLDISKELASAPPTEKPSISFVVIGHVDAGKSTLMGRLLYDCGAIDKHTIEKYKKDSAINGKSSFAFAWVFDQTQEERNRGVTIDICISAFETQKAKFTIVDAPGHRDFVPNMIAGSSQADYAVLVVDSDVGAFESGFNLDGQTKEHAILARSLGVDAIIVAVNKLDVVDWSQARFDEIVEILGDYLTTKVGFAKKNVTFVPTSGLQGDNVVQKPLENTALSKWYQGPTLLEVLENNGGVTRDYTKPLRLIVSDVYSGQHSSGIMVHGRLDSGSIQVGETVVISPQYQAAKVKGIKANIGQIKDNAPPVNWAIAGDNVILNLVEVNLENVVVGDVVCNLENPVLSYNQLRSRVVVFDLDRPLIQGAKLVFHRGRTNIPCKLTKIVATLNKSTGEVLKKKPRVLTSGQAALVEVTLDEDKKVPLELYSDNKQLGRFVLRQKGMTVAAGVVDGLTSGDKKQ